MAKIKQQLQEARAKDVKVLASELQKSQLELQKMRVNLAFGKGNKPSMIRQQIKAIARLHTVIREKETSHE